MGEEEQGEPWGNLSDRLCGTPLVRIVQTGYERTDSATAWAYGKCAVVAVPLQSEPLISITGSVKIRR